MSTYKFRFEFIDNIRSVTSGIKAQFAQMKASAKAFADQVNANRGAAGFRNMTKASTEFFNPDRVKSWGASLVSMNDDLMRSEGLILSVMGSQSGLDAARLAAKDLQASIGISVIDATKGLAQMLPLAKGNLKAASEMTTLAAGLGALNKDEGFSGAAFALKELDSGDAVSLKERFNIRVPDKKEAEAIAKRDGKTVQQVLFDSLQSQLDTTYGQGKKGAGVKALLAIDSNTIGGQVKLMTASIVSAIAPIITTVGPKITKFFTGISTWMSENRPVVERLVPPILAVVGAFAGFAVVSSIVSGVTAAVSGFGVVLGVLTSPVTLIVVGVAALTYGVIQLWNNFKGFRGFLVGFFNTMKELGKILIERLIAPFKALGKLVVGIFTGDWKMIKSSFKDSLRAFDFKSDMQRIGNAAREGYQKGVDAKPITLFGKKKNGKAEENPYKQLMAGGAGATGAGGAAAGSGGGAGGGGGLSSVGGIGGEGVSGSGKDVRISINKLVETMNVYVGGGIKEGATKIKQEIERALIDAVNDFNYAN